MCEVIARYPRALVVGALTKSQSKLVRKVIINPFSLRWGAFAFTSAATIPGAPIFELQEACVKFGSIDGMMSFAQRIIGADVVELTRGIANADEDPLDEFSVKETFLKTLAESFPQLLTAEVMSELSSGVVL